VFSLVNEPDGTANLPRIRREWYIKSFVFDICSHSLFFVYLLCITQRAYGGGKVQGAMVSQLNVGQARVIAFPRALALPRRRFPGLLAFILCTQ